MNIQIGDFCPVTKWFLALCLTVSICPITTHAATTYNCSNIGTFKSELKKLEQNYRAARKDFAGTKKKMKSTPKR